MAVIGARGLISSSWWFTLLRGVLALGLGLMAFLLPGITLTALVWLWGAYAVLDGTTALAASFSRDEHRWWHLVEGIAGIMAGIVAFLLPGISALLLLFIIASWAIVTGFFEILAAVRLRNEIRDEWLLALAGFISISLGVALVAVPTAGLLAMVWLVGAYAVLFGLSLLFLALRERSAT